MTRRCARRLVAHVDRGMGHGRDPRLELGHDPLGVVEPGLHLDLVPGEDPRA